MQFFIISFFVFFYHPGFVVPGRETEVCRLLKCIYGLKQAPRVWNEKINDFLIRFGLTPTTADPCIYHRRRGEELTILVLYVDDGLICSNRVETLTEIVDYLSSEFKIRTLTPSRFLGVDIIRDRAKKELRLSQTPYLMRTLNKFNMGSCKGKATPLVPGLRLTKAMAPSAEEEIQQMKRVPYREAVGSLMYLSTMTRPDISFAVSQVSKFCENPGPAHWSAIKRIFAYLSGTSTLGLRYSTSAHPNHLVGYSDADFAEDPDSRK